MSVPPLLGLALSMDSYCSMMPCLYLGKCSISDNCCTVPWHSMYLTVTVIHDLHVLQHFPSTVLCIASLLDAGCIDLCKWIKFYDVCGVLFCFFWKEGEIGKPIPLAHSTQTHGTLSHCWQWWRHTSFARWNHSDHVIHIVWPRFARTQQDQWKQHYQYIIFITVLFVFIFFLIDITKKKHVQYTWLFFRYHKVNLIYALIPQEVLNVHKHIWFKQVFTCIYIYDMCTSLINKF